ncbi:MAG: hypothetical protein BGO67_08605 [Alphaproteobacteria bacterium 41-28]|nr:MAG: hypothetical protein BGO67_08605 [Alphaproteobacteria bacterium 41-28]
MKISIFLSAAVTALVWVNPIYAEELFPESTKDIQKCYDWAATHGGTIHYEPASQFCQALDNCLRNRSSSRVEYDECVAEAKHEYNRQISGRLPEATAAPSDLNIPIATESANSEYERAVGKGFEGENAAQVE